MGDIGRLRQNVNVNKNAYGGKINVVYTDSLDYENDQKPQKSSFFTSSSSKVITEQPLNRYCDQIDSPFSSSWFKNDSKPANSKPKKSDKQKEFEEKALANEKPDLSHEQGYFCCT
ncbi:unnamed protein product [Bursaphelenchus okinawaensis]|uniref:Uncharacterized protein n=1 Tax=Bursaphelenchus okinawaensis TaxID=465554 RepID=A0A811L7M3_9BILA|nr:unnamed protein product [Bursaphelenchus okinawaensis]CAG9117294.1 unnamed protein product [Bursaphelenchus okinawaensis]